MAKKDQKWSYKMTDQVIKIKHSEEMQEMFENALNMPQKMKDCWNELRKDLILS